MLKVAVIGAGAAGLSCARHLKSYPNRFTFTVLEKANVVGGTWVYTDKTDTDECGLPIHSSMSAELRTNLPKEVMKFPNIPFREDLPSFIAHSDVLQYLQDFATRFNLHENIKFHTNVELVEPLTEEPGVSLEEDHQSGRRRRRRRREESDISIIPDNVKWMVHTRDLETGALNKDIFDIVFVCNGHYFKPYTPEIPGLDNFPGGVIHSHTYRRADGYRGRVLVVGSRASGSDILFQLAPTALSVCLVYHRDPVHYPLPSNAEQLPSITSIGADGAIHFKNGENRIVDDIIFCTGYEYSYPFLATESGITVEAGRCIEHLYKQTFNIRSPSLVFIGISYPAVQFPLMDVQVRFALSVLIGRTRLPSQEEMMAVTRDEYDRQSKQGVPHKHTHRLPNQFEFIDELIHFGQLEPHPQEYEKLNQM